MSSVQNRIDALAARQGTSAEEVDLLASAVELYEPAGSPGANTTWFVRLESRTEAFHKTFAGTDVSTAGLYGHEPDEPPMHECAAWRLAAALGAPLSGLVATCVLRTCEGEPGALSRRIHGEGWTDEPMTDTPEQAEAAGFWDALVAQQDRHAGNLRYRPGTLGLIDHGFAFARPGDHLNWSLFLAWRWHEAEDDLREWEREALSRLLASTDLLGMAVVLAADRAEALAERARRMLDTDRLLRPGEF
jgi:hypothetical protein